MSSAHYSPLSQGVSTSPRFSRRQLAYVLLSMLSLSLLLGLGGWTSAAHRRVSPSAAKAWFKANVVGSAYYPGWLPQLDPSAAEVMLKQLTTIPGGFAAYDRNEGDNYRWITEAKLRQLTACLARGDCPENADKIVVLGGWHCQWALHDDYHGGEGVWCLGLYRSLERQGFTVLQGGDNDYGESRSAGAASGGTWRRVVLRGVAQARRSDRTPRPSPTRRTHHSSAPYSRIDRCQPTPRRWSLTTAEYVYHLYRQFGDYIRVVLGEPGDEKHKGTFDHYVKSKERPDGIPAWKVSLLMRAWRDAARRRLRRRLRPGVVLCLPATVARESVGKWPSTHGARFTE